MAEVMKETVFDGNEIASIVTEAEMISDYNSIRFFANGNEIRAKDLEMIVYNEVYTAEKKLKTIEELDCYMQYKWNTVFECWGGCLTKIEKDPIYRNGTAHFIKYFAYNSQKECLEAATKWANSHPKELKNYKGD